MPESLTNLPGRDDVLSINDTEVGEEWRSHNGQVRLTMTQQLWAPIRALLLSDSSVKEFMAHRFTYAARNIFNSATLDIRTAEGLRTSPVIQRGISELFESIREGRKLTFDEIKATEEEILELFEDAAVRHRNGQQSHIEKQLDDLKGATGYFALKGLLTHSDLWDERKPQRTKLPTRKKPLPSQPDIGDGIWLPSQHTVLISQGAKELKSRFYAHHKRHHGVPFDLSAHSTWRLLHADALSQLERRGVSDLPSLATAKNYFAPQSETLVRYFTLVLFIAQGFHQITDT